MAEMAEQVCATSTRLAAYALRDHAFPLLARTRALDAITDCVGCMLATFTEHRIANPRLQALIPKVRMKVDNRVRHDPAFASVVEIETNSGERHEQLVRIAIGKPARWFTRQQSRDKFFDCGGGVFAPDQLERIFALLQSFDDKVF